MSDRNEQAGREAKPSPSRASRGLKDDYVLTRTIPTRWMDNDVYGHVNNVVYYSFFDTAVNAALIERQLLDPAGSPIIGLVVETGCRYHAALSFPQDVQAAIRVAHIGKSSVRYEVGLFATESDLAAAEGHFVHVYVDRATRRPAPLPAPLRDFLTTLVRKDAA